MKLKGVHPGMFLLCNALAVSGGIGIEHAKGCRDQNKKEPDPDYDLMKLAAAEAKRERKRNRK